ncbi:hypothetical protein I552_7378 [Mycobacterium xenopi 3993]|nr:hypothetical protein I552_7378 [Mycobacterium xenopi 3993]
MSVSQVSRSPTSRDRSTSSSPMIVSRCPTARFSARTAAAIRCTNTAVVRPGYRT